MPTAANHGRRPRCRDWLSIAAVVLKCLGEIPAHLSATTDARLPSDRFTDMCETQAAACGRASQDDRHTRSFLPRLTAIADRNPSRDHQAAWEVERFRAVRDCRHSSIWIRPWCQPHRPRPQRSDHGVLLASSRLVISTKSRRRECVMRAGTSTRTSGACHELDLAVSSARQLRR